MTPVLRFAISSYSLCIGLGLTAGLWVAMSRGPLYGLSHRRTFWSYAAAAIGALIGGRLFFVLQGLPDLIHGGLTLSGLVEYVAGAGQVFYGGLFGALASLALEARIVRVSWSDLLDPLLPALPLAQAFGRAGCFMAGCCYGQPSDFGVYMPAAGTRVFPIQLVESACVFGIFVLLMRVGRQRTVPGKLLGLYLFWYGACRFAIEFLRGDAVRGHIGPLSVAQWISILCVAAGFLMLHRARTAKALQTHEDALRASVPES